MVVAASAWPPAAPGVPAERAARTCRRQTPDSRSESLTESTYTAMHGLPLACLQQHCTLRPPVQAALAPPHRPGLVRAARKGFGKEQAPPARAEGAQGGAGSAGSSRPGRKGAARPAPAGADSKVRACSAAACRPRARAARAAGVRTTARARAQAVRRAVEVVEGRDVRPVQPQEAAQGRIDYVQARRLAGAAAPAARPLHAALLRRPPPTGCSPARRSSEEARGARGRRCAVGAQGSPRTWGAWRSNPSRRARRLAVLQSRRAAPARRSTRSSSTRSWRGAWESLRSAAPLSYQGSGYWAAARMPVTRRWAAARPQRIVASRLPCSGMQTRVGWQRSAKQIAHSRSGPHTRAQARTHGLGSCTAVTPLYFIKVLLGHPVAASQNAAQAAGELAVAQPEGAAPLPPFERWGFREERYIQWLADMQAAHLSLEAAVADATTVASTEHYGAPPRRPPRRSLWLTCFCVRGAPGPTTLVHRWRRGGGC